MDKKIEKNETSGVISEVLSKLKRMNLRKALIWYQSQRNFPQRNLERNLRGVRIYINEMDIFINRFNYE